MKTTNLSILIITGVAVCLLLFLPGFPAQASHYSFSSSFGTFGNSTGQFSAPRGITINSTGFIFVADSNNFRIQILNSTGSWKQTIGGNDSRESCYPVSGTANGQFSDPTGIALNSTGFMFVADALNHRIQIFNPSGNWRQTIGGNGPWESGGGNATNQFNYPFGIAVNSTDFIFVADGGNARIQIFSDIMPPKATIAKNPILPFPKSSESTPPSPLKQIATGVAPRDVTCKEGLKLIIKAEDGSPACVMMQTVQRLVYFGWGHIPPTDVFFSESNSTRHIVDMSPVLGLHLSVNSTTIPSGQKIGIKLSVDNPLQISINVTAQDNWLYENVLSSPCLKNGYGITILEGYHTIENLSEGENLNLYGFPSCSSSLEEVKAYQFQPQSDQVKEIACEQFPCITQTYEMGNNYGFNRYWNGMGDSQFFKPDTYTVIGADEWGHVAIKHFVVTNSTSR